MSASLKIEVKERVPSDEKPSEAHRAYMKRFREWCDLVGDDYLALQVEYQRQKSGDLRDERPSGFKRHTAKQAWDLLTRRSDAEFVEELEASRIRTPIPDPVSFDD